LTVPVQRDKPFASLFIATHLEVSQDHVIVEQFTYFLKRQFGVSLREHPNQLIARGYLGARSGASYEDPHERASSASI
jgi:hypothetical protein